MATTATPGTLAPGGSFLLDSPRAEDVFSPVELTDDHPVLVVRGGSAAEWTRAREVGAGDLIAYPIAASGVEREAALTSASVALRTRAATANR